MKKLLTAMLALAIVCTLRADEVDNSNAVLVYNGKIGKGAVVTDTSADTKLARSIYMVITWYNRATDGDQDLLQYVAIFTVDEKNKKFEVTQYTGEEVAPDVAVGDQFEYLRLTGKKTDVYRAALMAPGDDSDEWNTSLWLGKDANTTVGTTKSGTKTVALKCTVPSSLTGVNLEKAVDAALHYAITLRLNSTYTKAFNHQENAWDAETAFQQAVAKLLTDFQSTKKWLWTNKVTD